ncbi:hypothetical protein ACIRSS_15075 [Amycolatopsis sp. NPDC101161]|uniref:hypothetical protein n=1 Tax=Amycolatopsis sp. NPDC101161 TaxID=3363940 RepID=UPI00381A8213
MITVATLWRRWWRAFAAVFVLLVSWLAGDAFRTAEQVTTLIIDLRPPYDQNAVERQIALHPEFSGNVIFVVAEGARQPCGKTSRRGGGARPDGTVVTTGYCPFPHLAHSTVVLGGPPTPESVAEQAGRLSVTVLRADGPVYEAGREQGDFAWYAALLTGGALLATVLALHNAVSPRKRPSSQAATEVPPPGSFAQLGGSVIEHQPPGWYPAPRPLDGARPSDAPSGPPPPPVIPRQPPGDRPPDGAAPAEWSPPTPAHVVLAPTGSPVLPELARVVREAGGRAVARTHLDAPGGYVALGDVVVWVASPAGGVLPDEPVRVEYTGDPAAPLTISPAPSRSAPEQGYHR